MRKNLKTISSRKISKKNLHSPTDIKYVEYCRIKLLAEKNMYSDKNKGEYVMKNVAKNEEIDVEEIVKELSKKYNKREILLNALINENKKHGFSIIESKTILNEFWS